MMLILCSRNRSLAIQIYEIATCGDMTIFCVIYVYNEVLYKLIFTFVTSTDYSCVANLGDSLLIIYKNYVCISFSKIFVLLCNACYATTGRAFLLYGLSRF